MKPHIRLPTKTTVEKTRYAIEIRRNQNAQDDGNCSLQELIEAPSLVEAYKTARQTAEELSNVIGIECAFYVASVTRDH